MGFEGLLTREQDPAHFEVKTAGTRYLRTEDGVADLFARVGTLFRAFKFLPPLEADTENATAAVLHIYAKRGADCNSATPRVHVRLNGQLVSDHSCLSWPTQPIWRTFSVPLGLLHSNDRNTVLIQTEWCGVRNVCLEVGRQLTGNGKEVGLVDFREHFCYGGWGAITCSFHSFYYPADLNIHIGVDFERPSVAVPGSMREHTATRLGTATNVTMLLRAVPDHGDPAEFDQPGGINFKALR
jgi:hypothetical protein